MLEKKNQKRILEGFHRLRKGENLKHANLMYKGKKGRNISKRKKGQMKKHTIEG
jgi:hypothetical protein